MKYLLRHQYYRTFILFCYGFFKYNINIQHYWSFYSCKHRSLIAQIMHFFVLLQLIPWRIDFRHRYGLRLSLLFAYTRAFEQGFNITLEFIRSFSYVLSSNKVALTIMQKWCQWFLIRIVCYHVYRKEINNSYF